MTQESLRDRQRRGQDERRSKGLPSNQNDLKKKCLYGHALTTENTYVYTDRGGRQHRECRKCKHDRKRVTRQDAWVEHPPLPIPSFLNVIRAKESR
jgi:hypothetical protein